MSIEDLKPESPGPESKEPKKEEPDKDDKMAQKPEEKVDEKEMADTDIINQIMKLASMLAQRSAPAAAACAEGVKPVMPTPASITKSTMDDGEEEGDGTVQGYPPGKATQLPFDGKTAMADESGKYPTGTPFQPPFDGKTAMKAMEETIQTMSAQIQMLNKKLNEPEQRRSVKTAEMSQADMESQVRADPDEAFLKVLQGMN
jgi:hypothetical protein